MKTLLFILGMMLILSFINAVYTIVLTFKLLMTLVELACCIFKPVFKFLLTPR